MKLNMKKENISMKTPITLIHHFQATSEKEEIFINAWKIVHQYMQKQKGFIEAALQRSLNHDDLTKPNFVNVAIWENLESFRAAVSSDQFLLLAQPALEFSRGYALLDGRNPFLGSYKSFLLSPVGRKETIRNFCMNPAPVYI